MIRKLLLSICIALLMIGVSMLSGCVRPTNHLIIEGEKRFFTIRTPDTIILPSSYDPSQTYPLVFVFHGGGGNGNNIEDTTNFTQKAEQEGFIVVYPYGSGSLNRMILTWNCGFCCGYALEHDIDDVGFIQAVYDYMIGKYSINTDMVYATGISNGGIMSYRIGAELSAIFAAIAPVAAQIGGQATADDELWQIPQPTHPVSVIAFNGKKDTRVPYDGGQPDNDRAHVYSWMSTNQSIAFWVDHNQCNTTPTHNVSQSGDIIIDTYQNGLNNTEVTLVTLVNGTHCWPGGTKGWFGGPEPTQQISATDMIWEFFKHHPKQ